MLNPSAVRGNHSLHFRLGTACCRQIYLFSSTIHGNISKFRHGNISPFRITYFPVPVPCVRVSDLNGLIQKTACWGCLALSAGTGGDLQKDTLSYRLISLAQTFLYRDTADPGYRRGGVPPFFHTRPSATTRGAIGPVPNSNVFYYVYCYSIFVPSGVSNNHVCGLFFK